MFIHYTPTAGELRLYEAGDGYAGRTDYVAIVNIVWLADNAVMLRGMCGKLGRKALLAGFQRLYDLGAETIIATRAKGRRLPFGWRTISGEQEDTWQIDLADLQRRGLLQPRPGTTA